jgi:hypothetical protein
MSNVENGQLYGHLKKIDFDRQVNSHKELLESNKRTCKSYQLFMASSNMRLLLPGRPAIGQQTQNDLSGSTVTRALSARSPAGISGVTRGGQPPCQDGQCVHKKQRNGRQRQRLRTKRIKSNSRSRCEYRKPRRDERGSQGAVSPLSRQQVCSKAATKRASTATSSHKKIQD